MNHSFEELESMEDVDTFLEENTLAFLYISHPSCSVCQGLLPQVENLLSNYPKIKLGYVNTKQVPEIAGKFSVFTVPVLLLFVEKSEHIREARIVHMDLFKEKIDNIYKHFE